MLSRYLIPLCVSEPRATALHRKMHLFTQTHLYISVFFQFNGLQMDYHLLALIEQRSDLDISSEGEFSTVILGFQEIQTEGHLVNQAKFLERIFKAGSRWSARLTGNP